ncbi:DUF7848 domain-containing protein [Streptomyces cinereoruber]|uniref:DUF7848 domain-containing protein n=1 Tax=Streptomyces cinereoruber TaxID=67260 RepID=UPI003637C5A9
MNRLFAFLPWRLDATGTTARTVQCKGCLEASEPGADLKAASDWAMGHAARTGHVDFDEVTTTPLRASLMEGQARAGAGR